MLHGGGMVSNGSRSGKGGRCKKSSGATRYVKVLPLSTDASVLLILQRERRPTDVAIAAILLREDMIVVVVVVVVMVEAPN